MSWSDSQIEVALRVVEQNHTPSVMLVRGCSAKGVWASNYADPPGHNWMEPFTLSADDRLQALQSEWFRKAYEHYLSYFKKGGGQSPQSDQDQGES